MRKPFADWDLENFVGLAMLACLTLIVVSGMVAIGLPRRHPYSRSRPSSNRSKPPAT